MAIEQHLYLDTPASRQAVRDALVGARIGLEADKDLGDTSGAFSVATGVVIRDDLSGRAGLPPSNGVAAKCRVMFRDRRAYLSEPGLEGQYHRETVLGVMALLKAFPEADAYWTANDAEIPVMLRRNGRLVLAQGRGVLGTRELTLVDLPYVVEPLGPW